MAEQQIGWQTMKTAPKDGRPILLRGGTTHEDDYMKEIGNLVHRPVVAMWINDDPDPIDPEDCWAICFWDGAWRTGYKQPTEWMEIPDGEGAPPPVEYDRVELLARHLCQKAYPFCDIDVLVFRGHTLDHATPVGVLYSVPISTGLPLWRHWEREAQAAIDFMTKKNEDLCLPVPT